MKFEFSNYNAGRHWLIGPSTYLADRAVPSCEEIWLPDARIQSGYLTIDVTEHKVMSKSEVLGKKESLIEMMCDLLHINNTVDSSDALVLDLRMNSPSNWAHAFTIHLPLALFIRRFIEDRPEDMLVVLPKKISKKIVELFTSTGFKVLTNNGRVFGRKILYEMSSAYVIRVLRHEVVSELVSTELYSKVLASRSLCKDKLFISRKDTRRLLNEGEVNELLKSKGYSTVYLEDYSLFEQIALLSYANKIIAVHGAGLGPLLLRNVFNSGAFYLIELFTPAHVTNCYRVISHQLGGDWIGVRGRSWPSLMKIAYSGNVKKYSLNDFYLDVKSLEIAIKKIESKII